MARTLVLMVLLIAGHVVGQSPVEPSAVHTQWRYACDFPDVKEWEGVVRVYEGHYRGRFEDSHFALKNGRCEVWLTGEICPIFARCEKGASVEADIAVEGVLSKSKPDGFGHRGAYERELRVTRVIAVTRSPSEE